MSYDLYFYKQQNQQGLEGDIGDYLTKNLCPPNEQANQWFYENDDTGVYFSFDFDEPETDLETIPGFHYTRFTFNLNFLRPDFFGREAFLFVDQLISELNLYVINPQATTNEDSPIKPTEGTLYKNWSKINARQSAHFYEEFELNYYPSSASDAIWKHNFTRYQTQEVLGEEYFVPKIIVFQTLTDRRIITLSIWPEHLSILVPQVDYFLIVKKYKKLLKEVEEAGLISAGTFRMHFGKFINNSASGEVILPTDANGLKKLFNAVKFEVMLSSFAEKLPFEKMVNVMPKHNASDAEESTLEIL